MDIKRILCSKKFTLPTTFIVTFLLTLAMCGRDPKEKFADEIGCDTPVKVVELGTDQLSDNDYEYFVLNICENGRHTVARINWVYSFDRAIGKEELLPVQEVVRNGHTEYSTYDVAPYDWFAVTHFSDTDEYVVRLNGTEKVVPLEKLNGFQNHLKTYRLFFENEQAFQ